MTDYHSFFRQRRIRRYLVADKEGKLKKFPNGLIMEELLRIENIKKYFGGVKAVDDVSLAIKPKEVLGLVGESGSGKTTLGKIIAKLILPDGGKIFFNGKDLSAFSHQELATKIQLIFQNPFASLNPKLCVGTTLKEAVITRYRINKKTFTKKQIEDEVNNLIHLVGLFPGCIHHYPHQFSGGQQQRIAIARALALQPQLIIADEPVSSLDISIQAQILNLIADLKDELGISFLFIAHDLSVINFIADRVAVMYRGKIVEYGPTEKIIYSPENSYTQKLLDSVLTVG